MPDKKKYYGKRPLWQWIIFYILLGIIVYGIVFYAVFGKKAIPTYSSTPSQNSTK